MRPERWRREAHCIADLRRMAKRVLPRPIFDFADGGAQDERTLRRNEQAFDGITLLPRPLNGAAERDLSLELFGRRISMPVIIGPTGLAGLFWPMGEQAAARAAASAGTAYCLSHGSVCALEAIPWVTRRVGCRSSSIEIAASRASLPSGHRHPAMPPSSLL